MAWNIVSIQYMAAIIIIVIIFECLIISLNVGNRFGPALGPNYDYTFKTYVTVRKLYNVSASQFLSS